MYPLIARINTYLVRWLRNKYRRYDTSRRGAHRQLAAGIFRRVNDSSQAVILVSSTDGQRFTGPGACSTIHRRRPRA